MAGVATVILRGSDGVPVAYDAANVTGRGLGSLYDTSGFVLQPKMTGWGYGMSNTYEARPVPSGLAATPSTPYAFANFTGQTITYSVAANPVLRFSVVPNQPAEVRVIDTKTPQVTAIFNDGTRSLTLQVIDPNVQAIASNGGAFQLQYMPPQGNAPATFSFQPNVIPIAPQGLVAAAVPATTVVDTAVYNPQASFGVSGEARVPVRTSPNVLWPYGGPRGTSWIGGYYV